MLPPNVALWLVRAAEVYLTIGLLFAIGFAFRWVSRIDRVAAHGTIPFQFLLLPGAALLWPLLLPRVLRGVSGPPMERSAHRWPAP